MTVRNDKAETPKIEIYNEDCFTTMEDMPIGQIDIVLTSPFYNTNKKAGSARTLSNTNVKEGQYNYVRYDTHVDNMTDDEYCDFTARLFTEFDRILNINGVVLYNINYGAENTEGMFRAVNSVLTQTPFTLADVIVWKKPTAFPNSCSPNRLTRLWEFVFVFCRRSERKTFNCNKKIKSYRKTGQAAYENVYNFIEAKNNDGPCPLNKATYSTELCDKLLDLYAVRADTWVYDPFMGSGTTAAACARRGFNCLGSEISAAQVEYAKNRVSEVLAYTREEEDAWMS